MDPPSHIAVFAVHYDLRKRNISLRKPGIRNHA
jgi:hypothetical protein